MKRLYGLSVVVMVFIFLGTSIGLLSGGTKESLEYRTFSLENVTRAYEQNGLKLVPLEKEQITDSVILDGVKPYAYQIANTEDRVYIYIFESHEKRYNFNSYPNSIRLRELFLPYGEISVITTAKNVLSVYIPKNYTLRPGDPFLDRANRIRDLVFTDLNKGRTLVFRGEGQYWEAQVIYRYILQFYKDAKGVLHVDSWETENRMAKYKGADVSEVGPIRVMITKPHGSSSGTGIRLESSGIARLGGGSSNGAPNNAKGIYTITIEWNGQKETFDLKAHPDSFILFPY